MRPEGLQGVPDDSQCQVLFLDLPVPDLHVLPLKDAAVPAVEHELLLSDRPVIVDVHPAEHGVSELVRLLVAVLTGQQTQDRLHYLQ